MANTYTWEFPNLAVHPTHEGQTNVVFTAHWILNATDGTHTATVYGTAPINYVPEDTFTPFASLTKAQVQSWVESVLGTEYIGGLKANLDAQIAELVAPTSVNLTPPWS